MRNRKGRSVVDIHSTLDHRRPAGHRPIAWLTQFDDAARGLKSKALKRAPLPGLDEGHDPDAAADQPGGRGTETNQGSALRQVVEAAVAATLFPDASQAEDDEVQGTLDHLCSELLIAAGDP